MIQLNCGLFEIFSIKALFKNLNNGTFSETKPQISQQQFRHPRSGFPSCVCVVVQFLSWFKIFFPLFWGMVIYGNEFKTKGK